MGLNDTPRANRLHIGIYGRRNAGKSSLINALTGQDIALVSDTPGTTTDPIYKAMELHPIGPVVFIDTAGFDDEGSLGQLRVSRTEDVVNKTDIGIIVIDGQALVEQIAVELTEPGQAVTGRNADGWMMSEQTASRQMTSEQNTTGQTRIGSAALDEALRYEAEWAKRLTAKDVPVIFAINKWETVEGDPATFRVLEAVRGLAEACGAEDARDAAGNGYPVITVSAAKRGGLAGLRKEIERSVPEDAMREKILGDLVNEGGLVLLVMPQDIQAPKGRLILPQVQTLRELLDRKCVSVATTADGLDNALAALNRAPDLIITDSQCFKYVYEKKPEASALTSFSVLFAAYKGDIGVFVKGASQLDDMTENSRVLIAEACTHVPLSEDIGREKIPKLLRKKLGEGVDIVNVCGNDFPDVEGLKAFDLIIHCGACMFNRKHVLSRISAAEAAGTPITNYGVVLAKLNGILDRIELPK